MLGKDKDLIVVYTDKTMKKNFKELANAEQTSESEMGRRAISFFMEHKNTEKIVTPLRFLERRIKRELSETEKRITDLIRGQK